MSAAAPLAGRCIVVTRPAGQAGELAHGIAAAGGDALLFPLLSIAPIADPGAARALAADLAAFSLVIFISPNAVQYGLPHLLPAGSWPAAVQAAAVGPGTARTLAAAGVAGCLLPSGRADSEALLALPQLAADAVRGRRVLIVRGDGGRELLADTLRERGALVEAVAVYTRSGPPQPVAPLLARWQAGRLDAMVVSSSEGLRYLPPLLDAAGRRALAATPVFVPHPRIAETAAALGLNHLVVTGSGDEAILAALLAHDWALPAA